ncbi:MAG: hypothetical protein LBQ60_12630 [Bacteroidales bacterium]|jgi:hypothetical protein|nr:hypothetical protein [Bacteroidales bacterium]
MKNIIFVSLLISSFIGGYAQSQKVTYASKKQIEDFFKSKTMIVMDANPLIGYNIIMADAVKKYWTVTPYEIISSEQFDKMYTDPGTSFVFLSRVQLEKDKEEVYYLYMNIVMGAKVKDITALPELLSVPLAYTGVDEDSYVDVLPLMVRFAQAHLENLKTSKNPRFVYNLKNYSNDSQLLKEKTLLVKESDLAEDVNTLEKIKAVYSGEVKIVDSKEMMEAIEAKKPNTAVLHQVSPAEDENNGRSYCQIFGTDDAKLYYYNHQNITERRPVGMLARDFRLISGKWF